MLMVKKNTKKMIAVGLTAFLFYFAMNLLPHPTSKFGDGLFDGVHGALFGVGATLILWAVYLNGQRRRENAR